MVFILRFNGWIFLSRQSYWTKETNLAAQSSKEALLFWKGDFNLMGRCCSSHASSFCISFVVFTKIFFCSASISFTTNSRDISTLDIFIKSLFQLHLNLVGSSSTVASFILPRSQSIENGNKIKIKYTLAEKKFNHIKEHNNKTFQLITFLQPCINHHL